MNRQEGIFHRRNVQTSMVAARSEDTTRIEADIDEKKRGEEDEDVDADSKETRLTLMEEVLLLGLKDKEVNLYAFLLLGIELFRCWASSRPQAKSSRSTLEL